MESILKVENLSKTYFTGNSKTEALKNISFQLFEGEKMAIIGPSGCGKTTLLNIIGFILEPTSGDVYIENKKIEHLSDNLLSVYRNEFFGYVVQDFALIEEDTTYDNIELPLLYAKKKLSKRQRKEAVERVANKFGISPLLHQKVKNLSGGQRQRVAIARAVINNPKIILADEPTGALDSNTTNEVFEILSSLTQEGKTLILITHNHDLANRCDRQLVMKDGTLVNQIMGCTR